MKTIFTSSLLVLFILILAACAPEHSPYQQADSPPASAGGKDPVPDGPVTFAEVSSQVLSICVRCHSPGGRHPDLTSLAAIMSMPGLVIAGAPERSSLYQVIQRNEMPPRSPLSQDRKDLVGRWIAEGANP